MTKLTTYEATYVIDPGVTDEDVPKIVEKYQNQVATGGEVVSVESWGRRRIAYEMKHKREGTYVTMRFKSAPAVAHELDRQLRLADDIMRTMIVRIEKA